ncbi:serine hydrolase [Streptomyces cacaoi]
MASLGTAGGAMAVVVRAGVANPHAYASGDDRETRSAEVLHELVPSPDNPNHVLLAHVVERVTGKPFPTFIQQEFITPLDLRMISSPAVDVPGKAKSYDEKDGSFTPHSSPWKQYGDGSVQTAPGELVRWADNYRTGRIGGTELLAGVTDGAASVGDVLRPRGIEEGRYGAGILFRAANQLLGIWTK